MWEESTWERNDWNISLFYIKVPIFIPQFDSYNAFPLSIFPFNTFRSPPLSICFLPIIRSFYYTSLYASSTISTLLYQSSDWSVRFIVLQFESHFLVVLTVKNAFPSKCIHRPFLSFSDLSFAGYVLTPRNSSLLTHPTHYLKGTVVILERQVGVEFGDVWELSGHRIYIPARYHIIR